MGAARGDTQVDQRTAPPGHFNGVRKPNAASLSLEERIEAGKENIGLPEGPTAVGTCACRSNPWWRTRGQMVPKQSWQYVPLLPGA